MAHTVNRIVINAPYEKVFDMSNDINRWKEYFDEYTDSQITAKEGNKITFKLAHKNGTSWTSVRWLFKDQMYTYAERLEPKFPYVYMKLIWLYRETQAGIEMTWIQDFTMDAKAKFNDSQMEEGMNKHSGENLKRFKKIIEEAKG